MVSQPERQDFYIPVMGATGAGKSTFINALLRQDKMVVGKGLTSCTEELGFGYMETIEDPLLGEYRIVLIDTPGFDDTYETDFAILEKIASWLKDSYERGAKLGGVIYLHDITAPRLSGSARRNLQMFQNLCGADALDNVVLATTKWGLDGPDFEKRHRQLITEYWKSLIHMKARVGRFDTSFESAWSVINEIISFRTQETLKRIVLQIQEELVDKGMIIQETQAAKDLRCTLQELLDIHKKALGIETCSLDGAASYDPQTQGQEAEKRTKALINQIQKLKVPLSRRIRNFFRF